MAGSSFFIVQVSPEPLARASPWEEGVRLGVEVGAQASTVLTLLS